jgi:hypothetical protein
MMRHYLNHVGRLVCAALGVSLLVWTPLSYLFYFLAGGIPVPGIGGAYLSSVSGVAQLMVVKKVSADSPILPSGTSFSFSRVSTLRAVLPPSLATEMMLRPAPMQLGRIVSPLGDREYFTAASPTWLMAIGLLLWPGLSLYSHLRRDRPPGFTVGQPTST